LRCFYNGKWYDLELVDHAQLESRATSPFYANTKTERNAANNRLHLTAFSPGMWESCSS